ncbi:MAG: polysaccharide deacetylase family protein [Chloroflexota bacterium]|nr:polysaccharide deacetylase family protein [Chloroflexota bacterium]
MPPRFRVHLVVALPLLMFTLLQPERSAALSLQIVTAGPRNQPVVALTFDDGTDPANTRAIFAILRSSGVPATFFPFGNAMRADPDLWAQVAAAGYPIGNHSMSHPVLTRLSDAALRSEIDGATALITELSGVPPISVLRPPYGAWDQRVAAAAAAGGYGWLLLWDVDPRDWAGSTSQAIMDGVLNAARDGSVILLHTFPGQTTIALPGIIAGLRARGFGFVTIPQLLGVPQPRVPLEAAVGSPHRPSPGRAFGAPVILVRGVIPRRSIAIQGAVHRRVRAPD